MMSIAVSPSSEQIFFLADQNSASRKDVFNSTTKKNKQALISPFGQQTLGFGLGMGLSNL